MPKESRYTYGKSVNRCSAVTPPPFIGAPPGHYRRQGLNRGVAVALPGSDAGIALVSAGGVTLYRGSAETLPAFTGAPPGHFRRQPGSAGASPGYTVASPGWTGTLPGC
ncbi:hypothetical protein DPMN_165644 [Dreissena polymorpha]|uniref:Uncharacterized protein n=1 Tax=Dreissena polymorpha TaxID=45954 RepID=A0A9D4IUS9_DREPO|nr:hypothetical protein DPMN_165644 [Dreissena polymorpha]